MKTTRFGLSSVLSLGASALVAVIALAGCQGDGFGPDQESDEPSEQLVGSEPVEESTRFDGMAKPPRLADGEELVGGELVAKLEVGPGSKLYFIGIGEPGAEHETVQVVSWTGQGSLGPSVFPELTDASPLELFNAATRPGTPVPEKIARLYGSEVKLGPQGWMLDAIAAVPENAMLTTGNCNNATFMDVVESYGYGENPLFRLDQVPVVDTNNVWTYYEDCYGTAWEDGCPWFYRYEANMYDQDRFYGRVAVCDLGYHPTFSGNWGTKSHVGPTIAMYYRLPGESSYTISFAVDVAANQVGGAWAWHGGSSLDTDRKVKVWEAAGYDAFDIGMAFEQL